MAETMPIPLSALVGIAAPGRHGRGDTAAGVVVSALPIAGLATATARKGRSADLVAAVEAAFGIALPTTPRRVESGDLAFVWSGPDRWLVHRAQPPPGGMEALLAPLAAHAAIVEQSHARTLLNVSGPCVRDALAKGVAIDLHPRAFRPGDAATLGVTHIGLHLWQTDDAPTYTFGIPRSYAGSFWDWLVTSAAEYGLEMRAGASD